MKNNLGLFSKLLLIFSLLATGIVLSFTFSFWLLWERPIPRLIEKNAVNYSSYLVEDFLSEPNGNKIKKMQEETGFHVQVETKDKLRMSGDLPWIDTNQLQLIPVKFDRDGISLYRKKRTHFLRVDRPDASFVFGISKPFPKEAPVLPLSLAIVITVILLIVAYKVIYRMFIPLNEIERAAHKYAKGDFDYHFSGAGESQLRALGTSIQTMAVAIQRILKSKQDLVVGVAHEFRAPLSRMKLNLEMLATSEKVLSLKEDVIELSGIVSDILEAEAVKSPNSILEVKEFNLKDLVLETIQKYFSKDDISVGGGGVFLKADPSKLQIALKNIISNAVKYSNYAPVEIKLNKSHVSIIDSGPGILEEDKIRITEAFYRAEKSRNRQLGGIGLGLYLTKEIIDAHNFQLEINSTNKGTEIKIVYKKT
ncbi:MAG: sensor histidine kinase [Bdellovibrionales bacterium]